MSVFFSKPPDRRDLFINLFSHGPTQIPECKTLDFTAYCGASTSPLPCACCPTSALPAWLLRSLPFLMSKFWYVTGWFPWHCFYLNVEKKKLWIITAVPPSGGLPLLPVTDCNVVSELKHQSWKELLACLATCLSDPIDSNSSYVWLRIVEFGISSSSVKYKR